MIRTHPYFMENEEWYTYDEKTNTYHATVKATKKARESIEEYNKFLRTPYDPLFWGKTQEQIDATLRAEKKRLLEGE